MSPSYAEFFRTVTGIPTPFPYQAKLGDNAWPTVLDIPTGLGKTAAVVVAWLYKRLHNDAETGRRLVYCLPMRVLVEQTVEMAAQCCKQAAPLFEARGLPTPTVHKLLGGDVDKAWVRRPEDPLIIVGTQDMLLSRALNRGYGMSRYGWPMHFGLLSNDCLWVFDETQLLGVGVETGAQLQALREKLGVIGPKHTLWMSATLGASQLDTVDHPRPEQGWPKVTLAEADGKQATVRDRVNAKKAIARLEGWRVDNAPATGERIGELASRILTLHGERRGLTLVVVNRVVRAQTLFESIREAIDDGTPTALIHARFRADDRGRHTAVLTAEGDRIVVATQAVEAGIDVSARTLITELAPWPSLVQRFGRCNRYGEVEDAQIRWIDIDTADEKAAKEVALPYSAEELDIARELLAGLEGPDGAGPGAVRAIAYEPPPVVRPVLRRRDLIDLFDTTPDICGDDIDVSRYVRDGNDTDVQVFWRNFESAQPQADLRPASREELCRVSIGNAKKFFDTLEKKRKSLAQKGGRHAESARPLRAWVWNRLDRQWERLSTVRPGQVVLLHVSAGGYESDLGWTGKSLPKEAVPEVGVDDLVSQSGVSPAAFEGDPDSVLEGAPRWVGLSDHLEHVRDEVRALGVSVGLEAEHGEALTTAGLWHDVGKAHEVFQRKLLDPVKDRPEIQPAGEGPWAKSCHRLTARETRRYFRHELASALAWLGVGEAKEPRFRDLVAYLVAAHHGKVRLSIRSIPGERPPAGDEDRLFARGVWDGDEIPRFTLPTGREFKDVHLDLSLMHLGEGSWLERTLALRDAEDLGPFRLALLEAILTAADWRASAKEEGGHDDA